MRPWFEKFVNWLGIVRYTISRYSHQNTRPLTTRIRQLLLRRPEYVLPSYLSSRALQSRITRGNYQSWPRQNVARHFDRRLAAGLTAGAVLLSIGLANVFAAPAVDTNTDPSKQPSPSETLSSAAPDAAAGTVPAFTSASASQLASIQAAANVPPARPLLFGMGAQLEGSLRQRLHQETSLDILTSWYNSPADLAFLKEWRDDIIPQTYANGKSLHLVVWTGDEERNVGTKYGPACGRAYPLSAGFAEDMKQLAMTFEGSGTLYVSMFTEFQTYPCQDNMWQGSENYYKALQDQYRLAQSIFKAHAPNSQVSLTWGGWQADWDDKGRGGGRSLMPYFADIMRTSDFQSFQAMDSRSNFKHITDMTKLLHGYGQPAGKGGVMVAHYKPDNGSSEIWEKDLAQIFTPANIATFKRDGLFAFSFMDEVNMNSSEQRFQQAKRIVQTYSQP